jgi:ribosomal protein S25
MKLDIEKMTLSKAVGVDIKKAEAVLTERKKADFEWATTAHQLDKELLERIQKTLIVEGFNNWPVHVIASSFGVSIPTAQAIIDDLSAGIMSATAEAPVKG